MRIALAACSVQVAMTLVACGDNIGTDAGADAGADAELEISLPGNPTQIVVADLNGDDALDLAIKSIGCAGLEVGRISVLLGDGAGGFEAASDEMGWHDSHHIVSGDFDGDGAIDLIELRSDNMGPLQPVLHFGDGSGGFRWEFLAEPSDYTGAATSADFDEDGYDDVAAIVRDELSGPERSTEILFGPDLARRTLHSEIDGWNMEVGDLDGDGQADLVTTTGVHLGDGASVFGPLHPLTLPGDIWELYVTDLDGDDRQDVVVIPSSGLSEIYVALAAGDGDLAPVMTVPTLNNKGRAVGSGDLDGDGRIDLVVGGDATRLSVLLGAGAGRFAPPRQIRIAGPTNDIHVVDLDTDGRPEIVLTITDANMISILRPDF